MARKYEEDGYKVLPRNPDISHQLNSAYNQQAEKDDQGFPNTLLLTELRVSGK